MQDENEEYRRLLNTVADQPGIASTVDIGRAIAEGKHRQRVRRMRVVAATAGVSAVAVMAIPFALQSIDRKPVGLASAAPSAPASATPTAKAGFQTRPYDRSGTRALPASCTPRKLAVPGGNGIQSYVTNVDPSGLYATGRIYDDDQNPVIWRDGHPTQISMGGDDDMLQDATSKGDAVGFSYRSDGPQAQAYVGGVLTKLRGGSAEASGINERGAISGFLDEGRTRTAVTWPSAASDPVRLAVPEGTLRAMANDIDEDGTIVGNIVRFLPNNGRIAYVWYPDGTAQALPTPVWEGQYATDFDARSISNGWVTGYVTLAQKRSAGVRWDLVTGKVMVLDGLEWSNDVSRFGWIVGMNTHQDAVMTDGVNTVPLTALYAKPEYGMNWGEAISDDGLTIVGHNDDKSYDGLQRAVIWKCK
ncbi:hypothetical protein Rhe02_91160 [Rhizocola hellebori]|uniref:Uncharacterized protein n=1 Tax=Rhizocola hellebori TaxID=1392758 RepID=A0A8J3VL15_9ACTN|nr:hypothetical protein [Rhizocola hellebori]GIH11049.1 hypothetical protein Rhe02_91160 [Rhizocola hellebori]